MISCFGEDVYVDIKSSPPPCKLKQMIEENIVLPLLNNITANKIKDNLEEVTRANKNVQIPQNYVHLLKEDDGCAMNLTSWTIVGLYTGWYLIILCMSLPVFVICMIPPTATIGEFFKASIYHLNYTHEDLYKPKREIIVCLIISMGFAVGESLYLISILWYIAPNLDFISEFNFFIVVFLFGTPLHILCGYFSGILNTLDDNNHFKSCMYTIPARALYMFGVVNLLLNPSPDDAFISTIVTSGAIAFLLYFIDFFSKSIPEIADESYMSLLGYVELNSDTEEEREREMQKRII